jgi:ribose transport system ATP-binding protein
MDGLLNVKRLSKTYSGKQALTNVDMRVEPATIHGLVGHNGSGKSTFVKILSGYIGADKGSRLILHGEEIRPPFSIAERLRRNVGVVHQDLGFVESGSVVENFWVGRYPTNRFGKVAWSALAAKTEKILAGYGVHVDVRAPVSSIRQIDRALIAMIRAVESLDSGTPGLLLLDEPTTYLPRDDVERLFAQLRSLKADGHGIIFITHRLEELEEITDHITLLREGRVLFSRPQSGVHLTEVAAGIVGTDALSERLSRDVPEDRDGTDQFRRPGVRMTEGSSLSVNRLAGNLLAEATFSVEPGEILGVTGLRGDGWEEIPYLLFGAHENARGSITVRDKPMVAVSEITPRKARKLGLVLIPGDRATEGVVVVASLMENFTLASLPQDMRRGMLSRRSGNHRTSDALRSYNVRGAIPEDAVATLSGGNQQKVVVAKWLAVHPKVLLMSEPMQGIDIGAKAEIREILRQVAASGVSVIVASSDYDELVLMCERVILIRDGRVLKELSGAAVSAASVAEGLVERSEPFRE